jgi:hypothetical protein
MLPDDPRCVFSSQVEPEALREILRALDPKEITELGCRVIKQPGACALCVANDDCNKVPMHNHCFPAETHVMASGVKRAYRRWYEGEMVEMTTSGDVLRGTPNHPILTERGWVALGGLDKNDHVVSDPSHQSVPNSQNIPIGEIFDSAAGHRHSAMGQRAEFHGDGFDGEVVTVTNDAVTLGRSLDGLAGMVKLDQVVKVRRFPFKGDVYNLETVSGWYVANNILVKNCRCKPEFFLMRDYIEAE